MAIDTLIIEDGIPKLIQEIRYLCHDMSFLVTFFNGMSRYFASDFVCPSIGLMQPNISNMQMLEAENTITILSSKYFSEWVKENG